jgi:murein DD-endopeptidase MepM/ murein hydrolase activator NlpD
LGPGRRDDVPVLFVPDLFPKKGRRLRRHVLILTALVLTLAVASPVIAQAAEADPNVAVAEATVTFTRDSEDLARLNGRIAMARYRLSLAVDELPVTPAETVGAWAARLGAPFSASLGEESRGIAEAGRARFALASDIDRMETERVGLAARAEASRAQLESARAEVERVMAEAERMRAERIAAFGLFPVAGPTEFIDSWGFARSGGRRHQGTDIFGARGTPVIAVRDGWAAPGRSGLGGLTVWLTGDDGKRYYYAHLDSIAIGEGRVTAGQVLGTLGDSGNARGTQPHLHFQINVPNPVNPYATLLQMVR